MSLTPRAVESHTPNMGEKSLYWHDLAEYDLETASAMLETRRYLYVGFMCHQAIEKALKDLVYKTRHENPPLIHSLLRLAEISGCRAELENAFPGFLVELEPWSIQARYPTDKERLLSDSEARF
jgi:HEPN domain-containing protein